MGSRSRENRLSESGVTRLRTAAILLGVLCAAFGARAEIEKLAQPCDEQVCFHWWPRLPPIKGWHQDFDQSIHYGANTLAPDGSTFADADAVLYAKALFKPRMPKTKSLEMLIDDDKADVRERDSTIKIDESKPIRTADGHELRTVEFIPAKTGNWERVAYGEEGEFYLLFTISARSEQAYKKATKVYEELVSKYRAKP